MVKCRLAKVFSSQKRAVVLLNSLMYNIWEVICQYPPNAYVKQKKQNGEYVNVCKPLSVFNVIGVSGNWKSKFNIEICSMKYSHSVSRSIGIIPSLCLGSFDKVESFNIIFCYSYTY